jgi:hypothetical protein
MNYEILESKADWSEWLIKQSDKNQKVYTTQPDRLIADYRQERETQNGYAGREFLELLQNAADAASADGSNGRVRIEIHSDYAIIANSGTPFDTGGVKSLLTANLSPKVNAASKLIGNKGLGFRSILNWTKTPLISSGELGLAFVPDHAQKVIEKLCVESSELSGIVKKHKNNFDNLPIPQLAFPMIVEDWERDIVQEGLVQAGCRCAELRADGFDTVIGLPFKSTDSFANAKNQIEQLEPHILLFIDSIHLVEIVVEGEEENTWSCKEREGRVQLYSNQEAIGDWLIQRWKEELPAELIDPERNQAREFELAVALPLNSKRVAGALFSYFPTDVLMPLGIICHATLELDATRKHFTESPENEHILTRLGRRIPEAIEAVPGNSENGLWSKAYYLYQSGYWSQDLVDTLKVAFIEEARSRKLIPTLDGELEPAGQILCLDTTQTKLFPPRCFEDCVATELEWHRQLSTQLEIEIISGEAVVDRLIKEKLNTEETADAICGILKGNFGEEAYRSELFKDASGKRVPKGSRIFISKSKQALTDIPDWAKIRYLDVGLRRVLQSKLEVSDVRELQQELSEFNVVEYSLASIVSYLVSECNRICKKQPDDEHRHRVELAKFLWDLFCSYDPDSLPKFPSDAAIQFLNQSNEWVRVNDLYVGKGCSTEGRITQGLYGEWANEKLADVDFLCVGASEAQVKLFVDWIGVGCFPREVSESNCPGDYVSYVKNRLVYPVRFGEHTLAKPDSVTYSGITGSKTLDGLVGILKHAEPTAILAWLSRDPRADSWRTRSTAHGRIHCKPGTTRADRYHSGAIPSLIFYQLSQTPWLPISDSKLQSPGDCILGKSVLEAMFPRPAQPSQELCEFFGLQSFSLAFERAGVLPGLSHMELDSLYDLLLQIPKKSADGDVARKLYRWLIENNDDLYGAHGPHYKKFLRVGKIWGHYDGESEYCDIAELRHVDRDGFPDGLLSKLKLADFPRRVGTRKIERLFGVKSISSKEIQQSISSYKTHYQNNLLSADFDRAKPFLKQLRQSQTAKAPHLNALERLKLVVCGQVEVDIEYDGAKHCYPLKEWEWFMHDRILYVRSERECLKDMLADSLGSAISSLFEKNDGGDAYAKMIRCEAGARKSLLKRMCGDDFEVDLSALENSEIEIWGGKIPETEPEDESGGERVAVIKNTELPATSASKESDHEKAGKIPEHNTVLKDSRELLPPTAHRAISIQKASSSQNSPSISSRKVTDGELCESKAVEFEMRVEDVRFPLRVGHLTGYEAPGCDILSFRSQSDLEKFKDPDLREESLVERFIEVKGRSDRDARIELHGNELKAAERYAERYYIYRLYENGDGSFDFSILQDPLAQEEEVRKLSVWVDMSRASAVEFYKLTYEEPIEVADTE